ncbi:Qde2 [Penicillium chermesinum]|nr:Qde2 [Penicillium chermesinum]
MSDNARGRGRGRGSRGDRGDRGGGRGRGELPFRPAGRAKKTVAVVTSAAVGIFVVGETSVVEEISVVMVTEEGVAVAGVAAATRCKLMVLIVLQHRDGQAPPQPDATVAKIEEGMAKALAVSKQKRTLSQAYPDRPGYGTKGNPTLLYANCLPIQLVSKPLYRYHVGILADGAKAAPAGKKARQIVRLLLEEHFATYLNNVATDYRSTLVASTKLPLAGKEGDKQTFDVRYKDENEDEYPEGPRIFKVTCEQTGTLDPGELSNYLASCDANAALSNKEELVQALNLIMGHRPKTDRSVINIGGNKHYSVKPEAIENFSLGGGLEAIRGFFVSARAAAARVVLNVQVKYAATYQAGRLAGLIEAFWQGEPSRNLFRLEKFLKLRMGKDRRTPPKVKRTGAGPFDVEFFVKGAPPKAVPGGSGGEPSKTAAKKGKKAPKAGPSLPGKYISVGEYFKEEYNIDVDPKMPVINTGTRQNPIYLPVEVCEVQPGQTFGSKIGPMQTAAMLNFAVRGRKPGHNAQSIVTKGVDMLGLNESDNGTLASFGVKVGTSLITVQARVLQPPKIQYAKNKEIRTQFGSWNMMDIAFSRPVRIKSWTYLAIEQGRPFWESPAQVQKALESFRGTLTKMGVDLPPASQGQRVVLSGSRDENTRKIDEAICDVRRGVININVQATKLVDGNSQYSANVGLKVNLKLGGVNQSLRASDLGFFGDGKTMLVGIDVTHPSPGSAGNAPSVAAIVASIDASLGQWPAKICIQTQERNEMVEDLNNMMQSRLKLWAKHNKNQYPENIVVYRDGVSEGQYSIVIEKELPLLKEACKALYPATLTKKGLPRLSIIIVGKRHNMRFYPTTSADAERSMNPKPGTVVDRGISESRVWDFYLQAHSALQGTARPAHYFTIWDEIFYPKHPGKPGTANAADVLQDLTHKMCYMFGRATKAVSVCPPAYYADLVCTRARCYLADLFDPESLAEGSVATGGTNQVIDGSKALVHPNVADTMFYI